MSWGKIDDQLHSHPKAIDAGLEAMGLWSLALSYCANYLTDGVVTRAVVSRIAGGRGAELAAQLVKVGLWEAHEGGGWLFHDFHNCNPSRAEVLAERDAKRAAGRRGAASRWGTSQGTSDSRSHGTSHRPSHAAVIGSGDAPDPDPDPDPDPVPEEKTPRERAEDSPTGVRPLPKSEPRFAGPFWRAGYELAVREVTGDVAWSFDERQLGALTKVIEHRCTDRSDIATWVKARVTEFVTATRDGGQYYAAWQPRGLAKWLDAGSPASSARASPRRGAPLDPYSGPRLRATPAPHPADSTYRDVLDDMVDEVNANKRAAR